MTKQRDLKKQIRARMSKTGESYTTARAQVLSEATGGQPCDTPYGVCTLRKGHRSDEHGDDHQGLDGTWWNVGRTSHASPLEEVTKRLAAMEAELKASGVSEDELVELRGFADPVPKRFAEWAELARLKARLELAAEAAPKCERCGTAMADGGSVGFYCPKKGCLPQKPKLNATALMKKAFEAWGITTGADGKLTGPDGRELKKRWSAENTETLVEDLKAFHGVNGEVELARLMMDSVFVSLFGEDPEPPKPPEVLWKGGTQVVYEPDAFELALMESAKAMGPKPTERRPVEGPTPTQLPDLRGLRNESQLPSGPGDGITPDSTCICGASLGANASCPFHHPPVVPVDIGSVALPTPGDVSIQSRDGGDGTTDFWLTRGGRDVYRLGYKDRAGNTVLATDATCTCPAKDGARQDCEFHHPKHRGESVDVARKLLDQAIADHATGVRTVVTVDVGELSPDEATRVVAGMKTRFNAELAGNPNARGKCPPFRDGVCVMCGRMPHACGCGADPLGTTYARCTNCDLVYRLYPTKSRTCEHCGHSPVEIIPVEGDGALCAVVSSATGQRCTLPEGHAADSPTRFHRFEVARGVIRIGNRVLRGEERTAYMKKHGIKPLTEEELDELKRQADPVRGRTEHAVMIDDANLFSSELEALPPVPVKDLVPVLEALKYINSGDAHADEAQAEAREVLEDFDKKHPKVLTALMDPRDDEDFDPEEPVECIVNGKLVTLPRDTSYREVVQAAGYDGERVLSVTYRKGKHVGGILHVGEPILVEAKMIFNVADTSRA